MKSNQTINELLVSELTNTINELTNKLNTEFKEVAMNPFGGELSLQCSDLTWARKEASNRKYMADKYSCQLKLEIAKQKLMIAERKVYLEKAIPLFKEVLNEYKKLEDKLIDLVNDYKDIQFNISINKPKLTIPFNGADTVEALNSQIEVYQSNADIWQQTVNEWNVKSKQNKLFISQVDELMRID